MSAAIARWSAPALLALLLAAPGYAATPTEQAEAHKKEAFRLFAQGKYDEGVKEMEEAYRLVPHPGFLLNIAVAKEQSGAQCDRSLEAFERFFSKCDTKCELHRAGLERAEPVRRRCLAELSLDSIPSGAEVKLDGDVVGKTPVRTRVRPGPHDIEARLDGYRAVRQRVALRPEDPTHVALALEIEPKPKVKALPSPPPAIQVTEPPPRLVVDQDREGTSSLVTWTWSSFALGAGGLVAGAAFSAATMSSISEEDEARRLRRPREEIEALRDEAQGRAIAANVGFALGAIGAVTGVVLLLLDDGVSSSSSSLAAGPSSSSGWSMRF
jgi:hypothetical protein